MKIVRTRKTADERPGSVPDIRSSGRDVTFRFAVRNVSSGARLVIRCGSGDEMWLSIDDAHRSSGNRRREVSG